MALNKLKNCGSFDFLKMAVRLHIVHAKLVDKVSSICHVIYEFLSLFPSGEECGGVALVAEAPAEVVGAWPHSPSCLV